MNTSCYALIMAGGRGTRFWPWSTEAKPKQFLPVVGDEPLLTQTYRRLGRFVPENHIYVIAEARYWPAVAKCLPGFPKERYISEPMPRNTAPSLIMANIVLSRIDPQARLLVVPADHHVSGLDVFGRQMESALEAAGEFGVVTAGIPPTLPHTGFGYIRFDNASPHQVKDEPFFPVIEFKEKPDRRTAEGYLQKGNHYWNSGMFVYGLAHFKELLKRYSPYYHEQYQRLESAKGKSFAAIFGQTKPESIDYALMEKVREMRMLKARFGWSDVGSWSSLLEIGDKDPAGNVTCGDPILLQSSDCLVYAMEKKPVTVIGLKHVAVVETEDGLLVSTIEELQRLKEVFPRIEEKKKK